MPACATWSAKLAERDVNPGDAVTRKLVTFGRILREAGLEGGPGRVQDAMRGLALVDLADREQVYHALRCTLVARHDHLDIFDAAFQAFWEREPLDPEQLDRLAAAALPPSAPRDGAEPDDGSPDE